MICASTRFVVPASCNALMMTLESPVAPDEVASAASVNTTGPVIHFACAIARSSAISLPCMRWRSGQNSLARRVASAAAQSLSRCSAMMMTWLHSSGTSVNGLPIMIPAASAVPSCSSRFASRIRSP